MAYSLERNSVEREEPRIDFVVTRLLAKPEELQLTLDAWEEIWVEATETWTEEGFSRPELYIDVRGYPILVAQADSRANEGGAKVYRISYNNVAVDVEVPPALRGFTITNPEGSIGYESIYTLTPEDDPIGWMGKGEGFVSQQVSAELNRLRDIFGDHLGVEIAHGEYGDQRSLAYTVDGDSLRAREIDAVLHHLDQVRYHADWAYAEADKVEAAAEEAAQSVDTSEVVSLGEIMALQEEAYRAVVDAPPHPDETWESVIKGMEK